MGGGGEGHRNGLLCHRAFRAFQSFFLTPLAKCDPAGTRCTYIDDEEIQPAPRVGEVNLEAVGHPLEQHLDDEDVGEDFVSVLQDGAYHPSLFNVDVLKSLEEARSYVTVVLPLDPLPSSVQPWPQCIIPAFLGQPEELRASLQVAFTDQRGV